ncbi:MAG TPA: hypothetical protein VEB22_06320 [Phycisphaerales bacterium]|nr:hypothetical protein [Phycisphaerales bacterium]
MFKKLLYAAIGLVVVLVIAVLAAFFYIDSIAKGVIERGGTYALGTETSVSGVDVGVFSGEFEMSGLKVANPAVAGGADKFTSPHFLKLGKGETAVSYSTLRQPTVVIPTLALDDVDVYLEKRGGTTNYNAILDHLKKVMGSGDKPAPAGDEKKFIISDLRITNVTVHVDMAAAVPGGLGNVGDVITKVSQSTITIDRIELKDVGRTGTGVGGTGVTMSQLTAIVVKAVLAAAAEKGGGFIPPDLLSDLRTQLSSIANLDALSKGAAEIIGGAASKVGDEVKKGVEDVKKGIGDALKDVLPSDKKKK